MAETFPNTPPIPPTPPVVVGAGVPAYEQQMSQDLEWAMTQGSLFFEGRGKVQETLQRITNRLDELAIPYAVVGGLALFAHGFRRYTDDVDLLVTSADLKLIHEQLEGRGYLPPFDRSKHLRDTESNVKIEFLTSGGFPGDGKPKPISFPDPRNVFEERDGIKYVNLPTLIELKLASGMTSAHRGRDLADVQDVIQVLKLSEGFAESLDPYVREKYRQLWLELAFGRRFKTIYRSKKIGEPMKSIDDLISLIGDDDPRLSETVSYTHLTLPTNREV